MNYAIIAAGEGSRLLHEGVEAPKPLVRLNGICLIDRLIDIFLRQGASSISIIINEEMKLVQGHLSQRTMDIPFKVLVCSTPSSMHSFFELSKFLPEGKFCLTTVDTIFKEDEFAKFISAFYKDTQHDGMMAVTSFIDDEKPLYVAVEEGSNAIKGFLDEAPEDAKYISGGIYCLNSIALRTLDTCMSKNISKMRNFQRELLADGLSLQAYPFEKIVDVDHIEDINKAEAFLLS
ncbi:hypothetical protein AwDysgo_00120 [Bacteroidales bacterium]|nr:hypothetical protein AwDysgo_00120 [Bacteroidales bacterium]